MVEIVPIFWIAWKHAKGGVDLPRFRGEVRAWDQGIWSNGILSSCLVPFFCSAPGGAILPPRPARRCGRRAQRRSRTAPLGVKGRRLNWSIHGTFRNVLAELLAEREKVHGQ